MSEQFINLSFEKRRDFIIEATRALNRNEAVLEKDIWVCWALEVLYHSARVLVPNGASDVKI